MPVAYSLIRFSTPAQADGDSFRRQLAPTEAFCEKHGLTLDTSLHESDVRRLGVSAFKGEHIRNGPLGKFIKLVDTGKVETGSWLLVEEIDRFTRQIHDKAYHLALHLMRAGITIATMMDGEVYDLDGINRSLEKRLKLMLRLDAAHEYSAKLSNRVNSVWQSRREAMRAGRGKPTNACPGWLEAVDGKFVEISEHVAVMKWIISERHLGCGRHDISTRLNTAVPSALATFFPSTLTRVPTFRGGDGWHPSTVAALVKNKALIGIYQPHKADGSIDGDPIEGFYPRLITNDEFWRAQWSPDNKGPRGRKTKGLANLLSGVCKCLTCGSGLIYLNTGKDAFLVCGKARRGLCENRYHRTYATLEADLLKVMSLFDYSRLFDRTSPQVRRFASLRAEIADIEATVERLLADFSATTPASVSNRIMTLERRKTALADELIAGERATHIAEATANPDGYAEFRALIEALPTMADDEERLRLRTRLSNELRRIIESATADGDLLTIRLRSKSPILELIVTKSTVQELVVTYPSGVVRAPRNILLDQEDGEFVARLWDLESYIDRPAA